jgi:hypothetical protein
MTIAGGKVMALDHLRPDDRAERRTTLAALYGQLNASALAYHSIVINLNVMIISAVVFLTGYFLTTAANSSLAVHIALATVPLTLCGVGLFVTIVVRQHYMAIARVIRRIDEVNGVFEIGHFMPDEALYPDEWRSFGGKGWHEIIFDVFIPVQLLIGVTAAALIYLR